MYTLTFEQQTQEAEQYHLQSQSTGRHMQRTIQADSAIPTWINWKNPSTYLHFHHDIVPRTTLVTSTSCCLCVELFAWWREVLSTIKPICFHMSTFISLFKLQGKDFVGFFHKRQRCCSLGVVLWVVQSQTSKQHGSSRWESNALIFWFKAFVCGNRSWHHAETQTATARETLAWRASDNKGTIVTFFFQHTVQTMWAVWPDAAAHILATTNS